MKNTQGRNIEICVDGYTRVCLTVIAVLMTVMIIGLWADAPDTVGEAYGAEPFGDSGGQRTEQLSAQKETTAKIQELITLMSSGKVKVQLVEAGSTQKGGRNDSSVPKK